MNQRILWGVSIVVVAGAAALVFLRDDAVAPPSAEELVSVARSPVQGPTDPVLTKSTAAIPLAEQPPLIAAQSSDESTSEDLDKMFGSDSTGNLNLNSSARLNIEKLYALNTPEELQQKMQTLAQLLPPTAYRQLSDLMDRYKNYTLASKQAYSPGVAPATEEDAIAQLDGLHALRVAHFGSEAAQAFFSEEEKLNRQLLDLMRLEKDQSMTMEEKAVKAQQLVQSKPELAAVYNPDRDHLKQP